MISEETKSATKSAATRRGAANSGAGSPCPQLGRLKGLSLFANVGIAETYHKDVGVDIVVANEWLLERARFCRQLYPDSNILSAIVL